MWNKIFAPDQGSASKKDMDDISSWDVVVLSFKLFLQQIQFWIIPNIWMVLLSIPIITIPAANAALYQAITSGLRDPALIHTNARSEMKAGFLKNFWKSIGLALIKWFVMVVILVSGWFWITQDTWLLRSVSIINMYVLVLWWLSIGYFYPILIEKPDINLIQVIKAAVELALRKPFDSLLFAVVSTLLCLLGLVLLGPILLIIPALRSILHFQGYWFLTGQVIPGFVDLVEYTQTYYE
jgi:hypothetical protein